MLAPTFVPPAAEARQIAAQWVVPLRTDGVGAPFFFLGQFLDIGRHIPPHLNYVAIVMALDVRAELPGYSFRQIAGLVVQQIRQRQPRGPYSLGGYCFSAIMAFEVALQLQEAGEEVAYLAFVDPAVPQSIEPPAVPTERRGRLDAFLSFAKARTWWKPWVLGAEILEHRRAGARIRALNLDGDKPQADFVPRVFQGRIDSFCCDVHPENTTPEDDARLAWRKWATSFEVIPMPGDHLTLLREPLVATFCARLDERLGEARRLRA